MNRLHVFGAAAALGLAGAAAAQSPEYPPTQSSGQESSSASQYPRTSEQGSSGQSSAGQRSADEDSYGQSGRTQTAGSQAGGAMKTSDQHRASKLMDMQVQTAQGDSLGKVEDVVFDRKGKITHVIVSHGGTLGVGGELTPVPFERIKSGMSGQKIVLDKERLQAAPSFADNKWPNLSTSTWSSEFDRYWSGQGAMRTSASESPSSRSATSPSSSEPSTGTSSGEGSTQDRDSGSSMESGSSGGSEEDASSTSQPPQQRDRG